jgi:hypothetical protein
VPRLKRGFCWFYPDSDRLEPIKSHERPGADDANIRADKTYENKPGVDDANTSCQEQNENNFVDAFA